MRGPDGHVLTVPAQLALIARLDRLSRERALSPRETDVLARLLKREADRERLRRWQRTVQRARAEARLGQLVAA